MLKKSDVLKILEDGGYIRQNSIYRSATVYGPDDTEISTCRYDTADRIAQADGYTATNGSAWSYSRTIKKEYTAEPDPEKVLYFEGAGCVPCGEVPNCRIRTAFRLDNGKAVYLEITGFAVTKHHSQTLYGQYQNAGIVDFCFYVTGDNDDCNTNRITRDDTFEYTPAAILRFANNLGASFGRVEILPDLAGYRVHGDNKRHPYNFGDDFVPDWTAIAERQAVYDYIYSRDKAAGERFPCFSLWVDAEDPQLLHYRNFRAKEPQSVLTIGTGATPAELLAWIPHSTKIEKIVAKFGGFREKEILSLPHTVEKSETWNDQRQVINILSINADPDGYRPGFAVDLVTGSICG